MTTTKNIDTASLQQPLLPEPHLLLPGRDRDYVVVLPAYPSPERHRLLSKTGRRCLFCFAVFLLFLAAAAYVFWPYNPNISIARVHLKRVRFHRVPELSIDLTLDLKVKVSNRDFFSLDYDSLVVEVGYKGNSLGVAVSESGLVEARRTSYVNATLVLDRVEILNDVVLMLEDLAKGSVTFDTESEISGKIGILFIGFPLKAKVHCEVIVDTKNHTVSHQSCYPEVGEE